MSNLKLGIIQSRGLGDILVALPIAHYYAQQGYEVYWPLCQVFHSHFKDVAPWIRWIPIPSDSKGDFFYTEPVKRLISLGVTNHLCLYQSLNIRPELSKVPYFQIQKFDEFKYSKAGVPFLNKWKLKECITRNANRELQLYDQLVKNPEYVVYHTVGSTFKCEPDLSNIPSNYQLIEITEKTDCVFDWLTIMEKATALILIDSIFSNLADLLNIDVDKYWIPRSHIHLTPVLGSDWTILECPPGSLAS
jgi:hypothetical protein